MKNTLISLSAFVSAAVMAMAAEPAGFNLVPDSVQIQPCQSIDVMVYADGAGTIQGMSLYLEVSAPFQITALVIDNFGGVFTCPGTSTGECIFTYTLPPGIIPAPQLAVGYVTTSAGSMAVADHAILARVTIYAPPGTPGDTRGWLTTNSPSPGVPSDFATETAVGQGQAILVVVCGAPLPGDFNGDCDVDADDLQAFELCASGPNIPYTGNCAWADLDPDGDVDQADFGIFQRCYSGANTPADPNCAN